MLSAHRVPDFKPLLLGVGVFALAAFAVRFARFDGGVAFVWPAAGIILAYLASIDVRRWPMPVACCTVAFVLEVTVVGIGWRAVPLLVPALILEPVIAAVLLRRFNGRGIQTGTVRQMMGFILVAGIVAPVVSGVLGALAVASVTPVPFTVNLVNWIAAHALGTVIITPLASVCLSTDRTTLLNRVTPVEAGALVLSLLVVALSAILVFSQSIYPVLFVPMLPLVFATVQAGRLGAVLGMTMLIAIGGYFTAEGLGPVALVHGAPGVRSLFLQAYLACGALLALPVAALLSDRQRLAKCWQESEQRYRAITESLGDAVVDVSADGTIRYASPASSDIVERCSSELVGLSATALVYENDQKILRDAYIAATATPGSATTIRFRGPVRRDTTQRWYEASIRAVSQDGSLAGLVGSVRDVTDRKAAEDRLFVQAARDPLTGIANRRAFMARLRSCCEQVGAGSTSGHLALIDLDHFKAINDRHGHPAGDAVLRAVAQAIERETRPQDCAARIGGEEFAVILWDLDEPDAISAAERLRHAIEQLRVQSDTAAGISVTASIGLTRFRSASGPEAMLKLVDDALYLAKAEGRNQVRNAA